MKALLLLRLAAAALLSCACLTLANGRPAAPAPTEGDYVVHNFQFRSGQSLAEVRLHYTTLGTPAQDGQGRTVTEGLGVNHLRLLLGTSMGCMHSWVWERACSPSLGFDDFPWPTPSARIR
jgi:homoserine acetyltransferase